MSITLHTKSFLGCVLLVLAVHFGYTQTQDWTIKSQGNGDNLITTMNVGSNGAVHISGTTTSEYLRGFNQDGDTVTSALNGDFLIRSTPLRVSINDDYFNIDNDTIKRSSGYHGALNSGAGGSTPKFVGDAYSTSDSYEPYSNFDYLSTSYLELIQPFLENDANDLSGYGVTNARSSAMLSYYYGNLVNGSGGCGEYTGYPSQNNFTVSIIGRDNHGNCLWARDINAIGGSEYAKYGSMSYPRIAKTDVDTHGNLWFLTGMAATFWFGGPNAYAEWLPTAGLNASPPFDPQTGGIDVDRRKLGSYDHDGNLRWSGYVPKNAIALKVASDKVLLGGNLNSDTIDVDPSSSTTWMSAMSNGSSVSDGCFFYALDLDGNLLWFKSFGTENSVNLLGLELDEFDNVYVFGTVSKSAGTDTNYCDFSTSSTPHIVASSSANTLFLAKYDGSGNLIWVQTFNTDGVENLQMKVAGSKVLITGTTNEISINGQFGATVIPASSSDVPFGLEFDLNGNLVFLNDDAEYATWRDLKYNGESVYARKSNYRESKQFLDGSGQATGGASGTMTINYHDFEITKWNKTNCSSLEISTAQDTIIANAGDSVSLTATGASTYTWGGGVSNGVPFVLKPGSIPFLV
ncbi:MAG: hypothetical protein R2813_04125 [Flavobacteriales bacterium]